MDKTIQKVFNNNNITDTLIQKNVFVTYPIWYL